MRHGRFARQVYRFFHANQLTAESIAELRGLQVSTVWRTKISSGDTYDTFQHLLDEHIVIRAGCISTMSLTIQEVTLAGKCDQLMRILETHDAADRRKPKRSVVIVNNKATAAWLGDQLREKLYNTVVLYSHAL